MLQEPKHRTVETWEFPVEPPLHVKDGLMPRVWRLITAVVVERTVHADGEVSWSNRAKGRPATKDGKLRGYGFESVYGPEADALETQAYEALRASGVRIYP